MERIGDKVFFGEDCLTGEDLEKTLDSLFGITTYHTEVAAAESDSPDNSRITAGFCDGPDTSDWE